MNETDHLPVSPGVYLLTHNVTGDTYVGKGLEIRIRVASHLACLRAKSHANVCLSALVEAHGVDFTASVLAVTEAADRRQAELAWIEKIRPTLNHNDVSWLGIKPPVPRRSRRGPAPEKVPLAARIDPALFRALQEMADADDRTISYMTERAIRQFVEQKGEPPPKATKPRHSAVPPNKRR